MPGNIAWNGQDISWASSALAWMTQLSWAGQPMTWSSSDLAWSI